MNPIRDFWFHKWFPCQASNRILLRQNIVENSCTILFIASCSFLKVWLVFHFGNQPSLHSLGEARSHHRRKRLRNWFELAPQLLLLDYVVGYYRGLRTWPSKALCSLWSFRYGLFTNTLEENGADLSLPLGPLSHNTWRCLQLILGA